VTSQGKRGSLYYVADLAINSQKRPTSSPTSVQRVQALAAHASMKYTPNANVRPETK